MIIRPRRATWHINHERGIAAEAVLPRSVDYLLALKSLSLQGGDASLALGCSFDRTAAELSTMTTVEFGSRLRAAAGEVAHHSLLAWRDPLSGAGRDRMAEVEVKRNGGDPASFSAPIDPSGG